MSVRVCVRCVVLVDGADDECLFDCLLERLWSPRQNVEVACYVSRHSGWGAILQTAAR